VHKAISVFDPATCKDNIKQELIISTTMGKRRSKGQGHIFKRGGVYYLQYDIGESRKVISLKCRDFRSAEEKAGEFLKPIDARTKAQIAVHIAEARGLLNDRKARLSSAWENYTRDPSRPNSSPGTLKNYKRSLEKFTSWTNEHYPQAVLLNDITVDMAKEYARKLWADGISWNTFNHHVKALHLIFRIVLGFRDNVWCRDNIKRKEKIRMTARQALTEEEVEKLLNSFDDPALSIPFKEEMRLLFNIGMWTGLRLADAALLKWDSVRFKQNVIRLIPVKTRKIQREVEIPIHPMLSRELKKAEQRDGGTDGFVMPNLARLYQEKSSIRYGIMKVFTHNGFETTVEVSGKGQRLRKANQYGFHSLRHTFATFAASRGVPVMILSQVMGDDVKTLQDYYTHLTHEVKGKIFAALPMISSAEDGIVVKEQPSENPESLLKSRLSRAVELIKSSGNLTEKEQEILKILTA